MPEDEDKKQKQVAEERHRHGGGCLNFVLCIALLVSSGIYLKNLNKVIANDGVKLNSECVPNLVEFNPKNSGRNCTDVTQWKTYAIIGIVRGSLYILQIVGGCICSYFLRRASQSQHKGCRCFANLISTGVSIALAIIPIYLAINLVRTDAIYSTVGNLYGPARAIFVICILELISVILLLICCGCILMGLTAAGCCLCCGAGCILCLDKDDPTPTGDGTDEEKVAMRRPDEADATI